MKLNGSIARAGFVNDLANRSADLAGLGFLPANFGWITVALSSTKVSPYFINSYNPDYYKFDKSLLALKNRFVLLTRPNVSLRAINLSRSKIQEYVGIVRVGPTGDGFQLMWGFFRQELDIAEIYKQLFVLNEALIQNPKNEISTYISPNYLQHYSFFGDEKHDFQFTYDLWTAFPELVKNTAKGIGVVDRYNNQEEMHFVELIRPKISTYNVIVVKRQGVILTGTGWNHIMGLATILDRAAQSALTVGELKTQIDPAVLIKLAGSEINPELLQWLKNKELEYNGQNN